MAISLNLHDLQFILKQIKIAEAHSNGAALTEIRLNPLTGEVLTDGNLYNDDGVFVGGPGFPLIDGQGAPIVYALAIPDPKTPFGLRTVDGSYNNLMEERQLWGAADQPMPRFFAPNYINDADGDQMNMGPPLPGVPAPVTNTDYGVTNGTSTSTPNPLDNEANGGHTGNVADADPRIISNLVADMSINNPAALYAALRFAESENPYADLTELMAARVTQAQAIQLAADAQEAFDDAFPALEAAVDAYATNTSTDAEVIADLINAIQAAATAVQELGAALDRANALAADPDAAFRALAEEKGIIFDANGALVIPNIAPDEGISAPFNAWMTFFGQFFDHGLDLINKGGNGTIFVPLQADDPLIAGADGQFGTIDDLPAALRFMVLTRSTTVLDANGVPTQQNQTTPFVDQNQTYTSHASHQVFLREYHLVGGVPVATGRLLEGQNGGLATWADVKAQAASLLGIQLDDRDALNIPMIRTDAYGEFVRGANGLPQLVQMNTAGQITGYVDGNLATPVNPFAEGAARIGHAFLDDIAHTANPINS